MDLKIVLRLWMTKNVTFIIFLNTELFLLHIGFKVVFTRSKTVLVDNDLYPVFTLLCIKEDVKNLNEVAHNRPRAQLVLGIQQENRCCIVLYCILLPCCIEQYMIAL